MKAIEITSRGMTVELSQHKLFVLRNALSETLKGLDDWDFPIRTGFTLEEAESLLKSLNSCFEKPKD